MCSHFSTNLFAEFYANLPQLNKKLFKKNPIINKMSNEKKICCDKCGKVFQRTNDLNRHNDRKIACNVYNNKIEDAVIQSNIIEDAVSRADIKELNDKIDDLTTTINYQSQQFSILIELVRQLKSTENDKYIQQPAVEKDVAVSKQKKTKKPKITYIPGVEDIDAPTNKKQLARQFTPIIIPENLKSLKEKMIYINDTYEPTTNLFSNVTDFYKTNELFEYDDDTSKFYIRENKVEYLIGECSNKCKSKLFITELFRDFINQQTKPLFYYDAIHLFIVDEQYFFDEDIDHSVSNPIACKFLDTFNSILAYTALREKDKQNILFDIKHSNLTSKVFNDIVVKLLQCSV